MTDPASPTTGRLLHRVVRNIVRLPQRTLGALARTFDPNYALERRAKELLDQWPADKLARLHTISGRCSFRECRLVAYLALHAPAGGDIVEIGALHGRVTAWLVEAAELRPDRPAVHSIDPHQLGTWDEFNATVKAFRLTERSLRIHRADSSVFGHTWSEPISCLWIDGAHEYDDVRQDIANFAPHVIAGGTVAFDDAAGGLFPGVERAISEWESHTAAFRRVATLRNVTVFQRAP